MLLPDSAVAVGGGGKQGAVMPRGWFDRFAHTVAHLSGRPLAFALALGTVLVWAVPTGTPASEAPAVGTALYSGPVKLKLAPGRGRTVKDLPRAFSHVGARR